ncbi:nicotinamidase [Neokomagataea anthophila]|uniref:nicotinamidase n=1 Tax=Neokomagataea anthophila TaxID=2826925 RepID=A0ABS5E5E6_9PROT|nr:nicotinamidase [Neokomagataea anthophila]MBR0559120.1 nicotinamidase [Neokomagataea anthophila]
MSASERSALIIIDVQNDFLPGGTLAVPRGDIIIQPINALLAQPWDTVIATKDWHPPQHCSFKEQSGDWPAHCIAGTAGAAFPPNLHTGTIHHIVHKGLDPHCDSYSAFFDNNRLHTTGLENLLKGLKITHLHICGLALDVCVNATIHDALECGFHVTLYTDAVQGLQDDPSPLLNNLTKQGVTLATATATNTP